MIECVGLRAGYGSREVLSGIDLRVGKGEMVGLLGPNGSGKTTLLHVLSGVVVPGAGMVRIAGRDVGTMRPRQRARQVAAVPQRAEPVAGMTVMGLVLLGRYPYLSFAGGYGPGDRAAADAALADTGLAGLADRESATLSGGEFQTALLARALCQATEILLLDEAAANLDVARKAAMHELLRKKNARGLTVVSAVHDLNLAALYCDRLIFLKNGRVAADGPTDAVFTQKIVEEVYETTFHVFAHPIVGTPQGVVVPGGGGVFGPDGASGLGRD
ncbi:ABC transporter ATP-binding protein [Desulfolutivibrio sulfoxidireducens]|uniref:ABC transporter ATP-binding protein n=1 Tax=Desulfolutivibrio sulfoxidireducens TaxID=2773299 RepID=UPI00159DE884|nr:ABC transporter ATP-binding protein [Desulfolutivibrio sulfoxidireducens]QLA18892.1 ATP-binding cassette domain-containing protein [Desulfolutivibrio sulfoxidireducens]